MDFKASNIVDNSPQDFHQESEDTGNEEYGDESNLERNLRRRKGKIMSCAKETIENATRMIRRKVPAAGHLMTPRRLWLNKIPTQCDVVIEFPENTPDEALRWLLSKIKATPPDGLGLTTIVRTHDSTKRTAFYISAPANILLRAAEESRLPKRLRNDLGGALKEFTKRESHCFAQVTDGEGIYALFTSQERQWLVLQVLQSLRAGVDDMKSLNGFAQIEEGQSIVAAWQELGLIQQVFPLHETTALSQLKTSWVRKLFAPQPLDDIASYFGVKVALYFAWLGHYTCALCVPAVLGTILYAGLWGRGQTAQDIGHILFSLFNVAWASLYLEAWRRYSVELSFRWGTLSTPPDLLEPPRPLYKGPLEESLVTGRLEPKESPAWQRRAFRYFVSFPIICVCLLVVFLVMFLMLRFQDWWDAKLPEKGILSCLSVIPKVLLAGAITLMDEAYYKLALWLNNKENYRHQTTYENHLIAKLIIFQFVNNFLSLFYIAFYLCNEQKLKEQLAGLLISRQIIGNLQESIWPYLIEQWRLAKLSFKMWGALSPTQEVPLDSKKVDDKTASEQTPSAPKRSIGQAEVESSLYKYDGTFSDHLEMLIQMGYVVLFSSAFPLAGLCALANNFLEIRSDAFKLANVHQRPFGQRVANIGTWQTALSLLSLSAVIVNCALIGLSGQVQRLWPGLSTTQTILLIVALEHVMLGLRCIITWLLPELPAWLEAEIARAEHCRREMQCKGPSPRPTPPSPPSSTSLSHNEHERTSTPDIFEKNDNLNNECSQEAGEIEFVLMDNYGKPPDSAKAPSSYENIFNNETREVTPESPISQTSTVLMRAEYPISGQTAQNRDSSHNESGACRKLLFNKIPEIPPFMGRHTSLYNSTSSDKRRVFNSESSSTGTLARKKSQPIQIPEIPPFRNSKGHSNVTLPHEQSPQESRNSSPPKIPEIPPYRPRKSKEWAPNLESNPEHHLTIGPSGGAEWTKKLKSTDTTVHRSVDCIVTKQQEMATSSDSELLKNAPSWTNVAADGSTLQATQIAAASAPSVKEHIDEEAKAERRSKLKQSLVKRARSVAIFSLKLKESRARKAEKHALEKAEEERMPVPGPGGELSLIPIEQLIQVDDVLYQRQHNSGPGASP